MPGTRKPVWFSMACGWASRTDEVRRGGYTGLSLREAAKKEAGYPARRSGQARRPGRRVRPTVSSAASVVSDAQWGS